MATKILLGWSRGLLLGLCSNLAALGLMMLLVFSARAETLQIETPEQAREWWVQAANEGNVDAQYGLGRMYETGAPALRIEVNLEQAIHWYRSAAALGHENARQRLATLETPAPAALQTPAHASPEPAPASGADVSPVPSKPTGWFARTFDAVAAVSESVELEPSGPYWSWWQGALALSFIMLFFWFLVRAPLGVSSSWDHIVHWRDYRAAQRAEKALAANEAAVTDALLAETLAQFGNAAVEQMRAAKPGKPKRVKAPSMSQAPWPTHFTFLGCMAVGAFAAAFLNGQFAVQWSLGPDFARLFGNGWHTWLILGAGGFLVGFGTRMAGGCTSGHGVNGCARLQPGSLVGTAAFFGAAVAVTLLLERVL